MNPFRTERLHILPTTEYELEPRYYLSRKQLAGMLPVKDLGLELYAYPMPDANDFTKVSVKDSNRTDIIAIGKGTGGVIQEWTVISDNAPVKQLLNHAGMCGRSMQQTLFVSKPGTGVISNPTSAGNQFGNYIPGDKLEQIPPANYKKRTLISGARMLEMIVSHSEGQAHIETFGIPFEWDPTGSWFGNSHGGSILDPVELTNLRFGYEYDVNYKGLPGLTRVNSTAWIVDKVPVDVNLTWVPHEFYARFGFDKIYSYSKPFGYVNLKETAVTDVSGTKTVNLADFRNRVEYLGFANRMTIGGSTLPGRDDPRGSYPMSGVLDQGPNAIICRALPEVTRPWSFGQDICMGWYIPEVTNRLANVVNKSLRWITHRGVNVPTNGTVDTPTVNASDRWSWDIGTKKPTGLLQSVAYLLIGTWKEVQNMITELEQEA